MSHHKESFEEKLLKIAEEQRDLAQESLHSQREAAGYAEQAMLAAQFTAKATQQLLQVAQAEDGFVSDIDAQFHRTKSISLHFTGASMQSNNLVLNVGQVSTVSITPLLADGTPSNGVVSNANYAFTDASATVAPSADRATALITGVAPSTNGAVTGTASCTVTDTDGASSNWTQTFTILVNGTVTPPPPEQLTQSVRVDFTDPA